MVEVDGVHCAQKVVRYFIEECDARLHWGKAGWPYLEPCFDGATHYVKWCDFGCAVEVRDRLRPIST